MRLIVKAFFGAILLSGCGLLDEPYFHPHDCTVAQQTDDWSTSQLEVRHDDARACPAMAEEPGGSYLAAGVTISAGALVIQKGPLSATVDTADVLMMRMHHTSYVCQEEVLMPAFAEQG